MIAVTRLDKQLMYLNPDHIICIEETPDTVVTLFNGNRYIVIDRASTIISRVVAFRARITRRATTRPAKKYLMRSSFNQFHDDTFHSDDAGTDSHSRRTSTPFHSRDN